MSTSTAPGLWREAGWILATDLRREGRHLAVVALAALLALGVVVVCAVSGLHTQRTHLASAAIWIALSFAGIHGASGAYEREQSTGALTVLLAGPVRSVSLFLGKTAGIWLYTMVGAITALFAVSLMLDARAVIASPGRLALVLLAGGFGFSVLGGIVAPLLGLGAGRDAMLALLVLPLGVPLVVAGARATEALYARPQAPGAFLEGLGIVVGLDALYLVGALWIFDPLVRHRP